MSNSWQPPSLGRHSTAVELEHLAMGMSKMSIELPMKKHRSPVKLRSRRSTKLPVDVGFQNHSEDRHNSQLSSAAERDILPGVIWQGMCGGAEMSDDDSHQDHDYDFNPDQISDDDEEDDGDCDDNEDDEDGNDDQNLHLDDANETDPSTISESLYFARNNQIAKGLASRNEPGGMATWTRPDLEDDDDIHHNQAYTRGATDDVSDYYPSDSEGEVTKRSLWRRKTMSALNQLQQLYSMSAASSVWVAHLSTWNSDLSRWVNKGPVVVFLVPGDETRLVAHYIYGMKSVALNLRIPEHWDRTMKRGPSSVIFSTFGKNAIASVRSVRHILSLLDAVVRGPKLFDHPNPSVINELKSHPGWSEMEKSLEETFVDVYQHTLESKPEAGAKCVCLRFHHLEMDRDSPTELGYLPSGLLGRDELQRPPLINFIETMKGALALVGSNASLTRLETFRTSPYASHPEFCQKLAQQGFRYWPHSISAESARHMQVPENATITYTRCDGCASIACWSGPGDDVSGHHLQVSSGRWMVCPFVSPALKSS